MQALSTTKTYTLTQKTSCMLKCTLWFHTRGGGGTCYVGVSEDVPFSWVYVLLENSRAGYQFWRKILKQGNILLGNPPNFLVEHVTKSQNKPHCFKSGKLHFQGQNCETDLRKFKNLVANFWKNSITESRYWPKILKQGVFFGQIF